MATDNDPFKRSEASEPRAHIAVLVLTVGLLVTLAGGLFACSLGGVLLGIGLTLTGRHD